MRIVIIVDVCNLGLIGYDLDFFLLSMYLSHEMQAEVVLGAPQPGPTYLTLAGPQLTISSLGNCCSFVSQMSVTRCSIKILSSAFRFEAGFCPWLSKLL